MTTDKKQELVPFACYELHGMVYVPHYKNPMAFVRPGYPRFHQDTYTSDELIEAGAQPRTEFLWPRPQHATSGWNEINT